jgi:hypothetical protein
MPPPHDLRAEQQLLAAALLGETRAADLRISPRAFWCWRYRRCWALLLSWDEMAPSKRRRLLEAHGGEVLLVVVRAVTGDYRDGDELAGGHHAPAAARSALDELGRIRHMYTPPARELPVVAERLRDLARQRWLIRHTQRLEAQLRAGERSSARLVNGLIRGLLAMRAGHRRDELRRLEQMAVDA